MSDAAQRSTSRKPEVNLADLVPAVADAVPDRCALVCDGDRLAYRQLMHCGSRLAQDMIARRARRGVLPI